MKLTYFDAVWTNEQTCESKSAVGGQGTSESSLATCVGNLACWSAVEPTSCDPVGGQARRKSEWGLLNNDRRSVGGDERWRNQTASLRWTAKLLALGCARARTQRRGTRTRRWALDSAPDASAESMPPVYESLQPEQRAFQRREVVTSVLTWVALWRRFVSGTLPLHGIGILVVTHISFNRAPEVIADLSKKYEER